MCLSNFLIEKGVEIRAAGIVIKSQKPKNHPTLLSLANDVLGKSHENKISAKAELIKDNGVRSPYQKRHELFLRDG